MKLFLLSNAKQPDRPPFGHVGDYMPKYYIDGGKILFIPYASADKNYAQAEKFAVAGMEPYGFSVTSAHALSGNPSQWLDKFDGIMVGGGNTFCLLDGLYETGLLQVLHQAVREGMPYMGISAGAVVACQTIMTTTDYPVAWPTSCEALGLVSAQIVPHWPKAGSEEEAQCVKRIREYHVRNRTPVIGLPDGAAIAISGSNLDRGASARLDDTQVCLLGAKDSILLRKGQSDQRISYLMPEMLKLTRASSFGTSIKVL